MRSHTWQPEPVLIAFGGCCGDGGFVNLLNFYLLGNRQLYIIKFANTITEYERFEARLSRPETCQLLNSIDQTGFFDYDSTIHENAKIPWEGGGGYVININAWRKNDIYFPELSAFINGEILKDYSTCGDYCTAPPPVLPAVSSTFLLLEDYWSDKLTLSNSYDIALIIREYPANDLDLQGIKDWPDTLFSIADFVDQSNCQGNTVRMATGEEALDILNTLDDYQYKSEGRLFFVEIVDRLPEFKYSTCIEGSGWEPTSIEPPDIHHSLSCSPEDGTLPIPEP